MTPLRKVFFVTDLAVLNNELKLKITSKKMQKTWLMVRGAKRKEYWTSEQMAKG